MAGSFTNSLQRAKCSAHATPISAAGLLTRQRGTSIAATSAEGDRQAGLWQQRAPQAASLRPGPRWWPQRKPWRLAGLLQRCRHRTVGSRGRQQRWVAARGPAWRELGACVKALQRTCGGATQPQQLPKLAHDIDPDRQLVTPPPPPLALSSRGTHLVIGVQLLRRDAVGCEGNPGGVPAPVSIRVDVAEDGVAGVAVVGGPEACAAAGPGIGGRRGAKQCRWAKRQASRLSRRAGKRWGWELSWRLDRHWARRRTG
jgi:hypothetical protein